MRFLLEGGLRWKDPEEKWWPILRGDDYVFLLRFLEKRSVCICIDCIDLVNVILKVAIMIGIYIILCYFVQILDPLIFVTMFLQELFVWRFDTFEKERSNSNQMIIASLCIYFKISYLWNDKKKIALRMKSTFLDFIREVPISSLVTTGMETNRKESKKRSERKGDEEDRREEKSGSFREWEYVGKYKMWSDWCSCNLRADFLGEVHDSSPVIGDF